ncbi:GAF domain-containing protein [Dactylosporangium vinaceum]|uniref:GAF domain-containing protein n=1 Tax=Dactylosporangium vinaceum TaxID=53362 RepID=A0ABV5MDQ4_9ACTN|nr:GAF domain-containing protein [Dactylosporangium vinaceum]UAC01084.1 GAF domain-containing protein [Dactylosporangium vinaceum]
MTGAPQTADEDMRALFGPSVAVFAALRGPEHAVEEANPAFAATIGAAPATLQSELDEVYRTGEPRTAHDVRIGELSFDFTCEPRRDAGGAVTGVRVIGVDTTQVRQAQWLMAEHRALLEQIARQAPLAEVLDGMARCIEQLAPEEVLVSVLLADADGRHLHHGAAPSLPAFYNEAIDGIATGDGVGSCGTAAHRREPVIVSDIAADPLWADFRDLAGRAGLAACWSTPILGRDGGLLGTFAMYHRAPRVPQESDLALARVFAGTAALAIERAEADRRAAAAAELAARVRTAAAALAARPRPEHCQLGGADGCTAAAELKIADSWGDSAWGCPEHVEEAILHVRSVFIASEDLGGLVAYVNR